MVTPDRKPYAAVDSIKAYIERNAHRGAVRVLNDLDRLAGLLEEAEALSRRCAHALGMKPEDCAACVLNAKLVAERGEGDRG